MTHMLFIIIIRQNFHFFFIAFLAILENENAIRVWRGDNDTTSVITHILQKYHEEKHVMGINQFYVNRW